MREGVREQSRDRQGKDFIDRRKEDNCTMKLREQESEEIKKKERRESVLWQDTMKGRGQRRACVRGVISHMPAKYSLGKTIEVLDWKSVPI